MVERFNGRVQREVLGHHGRPAIATSSSACWRASTRPTTPADNGCWTGRSPEEVVRERLAQDDGLASPAYRPPADPCVLPKAMQVIKRAKDLSQLDS